MRPEVRGFQVGDRVRVRGHQAWDGWVPPTNGTVINVLVPADGERRAIVKGDDLRHHYVWFRDLAPVR